MLGSIHNQEKGGDKQKCDRLLEGPGGESERAEKKERDQSVKELSQTKNKAKTHRVHQAANTGRAKPEPRKVAVSRAKVNLFSVWKGMFWSKPQKEKRKKRKENENDNSIKLSSSLHKNAVHFHIKRFQCSAAE